MHNCNVRMYVQGIPQRFIVGKAPVREVSKALANTFLFEVRVLVGIFHGSHHVYVVGTYMHACTLRPETLHTSYQVHRHAKHHADVKVGRHEPSRVSV